MFKPLGVEFAHQNIQINAIAQNFIDNPTYFLLKFRQIRARKG